MCETFNWQYNDVIAAIGQLALKASQNDLHVCTRMGVSSAVIRAVYKLRLLREISAIGRKQEQL